MCQLKLSVVIPCRNAVDTIGDQLEALSLQDYSEPWEVIVSDNGSKDETLSVVSRYMEKIPNLRVVDSSSRRGAAHARNRGAEAAEGEVLAFCDADDIVGANWIDAIVMALARHEFVASRFDDEKLNSLWTRKARVNIQSDRLPIYSNPPFLPHSGGSGLGVKRKLHEAVGGFDETLSVLEDTDYCWRIQLSGAELYLVPEAVVHVRYPETIFGMYRQARKWGEGNVLLYKKYRPLGMPKYSWKQGMSAWRRLFSKIIRIRSKQAVVRWVWDFGWRFGRLRGCIKYGVFAP